MAFAKTLLIISALSMVALEASAWADYDADCSKLPKGDKIACATKAKSECAAVEGYWPKRKCVAKVARQFDLCLKDGTFAAMCVERKAAYWDVCMKADSLDMNKPKTLPEFKRRALAYAEILKKAKEFDEDWGVCYAPAMRRTKAKCQVTSRDVATCEKAAATYKKTMLDAVDWYLNTTMPQTLAQLDKEMAGKYYKGAKGTVTTTLAKIRTLQELNRDLPMLAHREEDLATAAKKFQIIDGLIEDIAIKSKAAIRCPKGKYNKKRLVRRMRGSVNKFFGGGSHAKKVRVLRLNGKKSVTTKSFPTQTTESYPAVACTEGLSTSENAGVCRVFNISVKRTRVRRKKWGPWVTYVGHSAEMLCKNLR